MIKHYAMNVRSRGITFKESPLAHRHCHGEGVELGAAAHNPFNLPGSINIAPDDDFEFYVKSQSEMCGQVALVDIYAEANGIPLPDHSQNYIISSHVVEHIPNPIGAFLEWSRLLKDGGIVFMIFPKRDAHPPDRERSISPISEFIRAYDEAWTPDTVPEDAEAYGQRPRGHYWVFTLQSMLELVATACMVYDLNWKFVESLETDDKVGNGHCVVFRYEQPEFAIGEVITADKMLYADLFAPASLDDLLSAADVENKWGELPG